MAKDERDPLELLKFELNFLEKGGYGSSPREPWRAHLVFEDSPTCMNYDQKEHPAPCGDCLLMRFVPEGMRKEAVPCQHIPLNESGDSLNSLYRWGTQAEIEQAMRGWLLKTIRQLEIARARKVSHTVAAPKSEPAASR
jgi:hypothetical protein